MEAEGTTPLKFLEGQRVYLRPFQQEDAALVYRATYVGEGRRLTGTQRLFSPQIVQDFVAKIASMEDSSRVDFVIVLHESNEVAGEVVLNSIDRLNRSANIRIGLFDDAYFGKGYGSEAMLLMLHYGFGNLNLHRIELGVYDFNPRAAHVYEKLGFRREGLRRDALFSDHHYHDEIMMSLLEDEFRALHPAKP